MHKKNVYLPAKEQANLGPTAPAGPVYEEVSPKEEIELNTNQAYGPVRLWNFCWCLWTATHDYFDNVYACKQWAAVHYQQLNDHKCHGEQLKSGGKQEVNSEGKERECCLISIERHTIRTYLLLASQYSESTYSNAKLYSTL